MLEKIRKYKKACSIAECDENLETNDDTISKLSGLCTKHLEEVRNAIKTEPISLETYVTDDLCIQDYVADSCYRTPEASTHFVLEQKDVIHLLSKLDKREQEIIKQRFGLNSEEPKTLEQIGATLGFSKERIRQLENCAIEKLRCCNNIEDYKLYLND